MTPEDLLALAKQGNPKVIAAIMNHSTRPHGITVQTARQETCLHVLLESDKPLNEWSMVAFVRTSMKKLQVESIATVRVYGRQSGEKSVAWNQEIQLRPYFDSSSSSASIVTQTTDQPFGSQTNPTDVSTAASLLSPESVAQSDPAALATNNPDESGHGAIASDQSPSTIQELFNRPEAIVLLAFVSIVLLWQLYLDLIQDVAPEGSISGRQLAERLQVDRSTISRRKSRPDFGAWTQTQDPDGIAWVYQNGVFVPAL